MAAQTNAISKPGMNVQPQEYFVTRSAGMEGLLGLKTAMTGIPQVCRLQDAKMVVNQEQTNIGLVLGEIFQVLQFVL